MSKYDVIVFLMLIIGFIAGFIFRDLHPWFKEKEAGRE